MDGAFMGLDGPSAAAAAHGHLGCGGGSRTAADPSSSPLLPRSTLLSSTGHSAAPAAAAHEASGASVQRLLDVLRALLLGVEAMLAEPFPVPVPVPRCAAAGCLPGLART